MRYVRKIVLSGLSNLTTWGTGIGGIRFFDEELNLIQRGTIITNIYTYGETSNFIVGSTDDFQDTPQNHKVLWAFDTAKAQTGRHSDFFYWLSGRDDQQLSIMFKDHLRIKKITRATFNPYPDSAYTDRRLTEPFLISFFDDDGDLIYKETIIPSTIRNTVQTVDFINFPNTESVDSFLLMKDNAPYSFSRKIITHPLALTSNAAPAPYVASASSIYSSTYPAWQAFSGRMSTQSTQCWISANNSTNDWVQVDFGSEHVFNRVSIRNRERSFNSAPAAPKDFKILGSINGVDFIELSDIKNQTDWLDGETRNYVFNNYKGYRYYRIHVTNVNGGAYVNISDIKFSYVEKNLVELSKYSKTNHRNYGVDKLDALEHVMFAKNYILQDSVSEDANGLWTTKIDRKPLSIKFD